MSNFATYETMLKFFTPDGDTFSFSCEVCGKVIQVNHRQRNHQTRCPECQKDATRIRHKNAKQQMYDNTKTVGGDPTLDLVLAILRQAKIDLEKGYHPKRDKNTLNLKDCDPASFMEDGAALWFRAVGIPMGYDDERDLLKIVEKNRSV